MLFLFLSANGPINGLVEKVTGQPIMFMSNPAYFRTIYILSGIWQGIGWSSILLHRKRWRESVPIYMRQQISMGQIFYKKDLAYRFACIEARDGDQLHPYRRRYYECRI